MLLDAYPRFPSGKRRLQEKQLLSAPLAGGRQSSKKLYRPERRFKFNIAAAASETSQVGLGGKHPCQAAESRALSNIDFH